jgi:hypothetical protein
MTRLLQEMREQKKRVTDLDWSLANDQLLTSSGAVSIAVLTHQSYCMMQWGTACLNLLISDLQRMAACACRPMTMAYGQWQGVLKPPPLQPHACFIL